MRVGKLPGMQGKPIRKAELGSIVSGGGNQFGIAVHTEATAFVSLK